MTKNNNRNSGLDYLKAVAAILVVLGHAVTYYESSIGGMGGFWKILNCIIYAVHVPLFFAAAGYLCHRQPVGEFYKKKLVRILIPFITFTVLKLIYSVVIAHEALNAGLLKDAFLYGSFYWFCYAILLVYLIAPLMWKKEGQGVTPVSVAILIACIVLQVVFTIKGPAGYGPFQVVQIVYCYPFFFAGYFVKQYEERVKSFTSKAAVKAAAIVLGAVLITVYVYIDMKGMEERLFYFPSRLGASLALIAFAAGITTLIKGNIRSLSYLGKISLQIMLFDSIYKLILFKIVMKLGIMNPVVCIPVTIIDIALTAATCIIIRRIPYLRALFGVSSMINL